MKNQVKGKQYIILFHILLLFGAIYIYLLENNSHLVYNKQYSNPLMINKSLSYNMRNNHFNKFLENINLKNTNVNIENIKGITLLMQCIIEKCEDKYLDILIDKTDSDFKNKYSETPLHYAILFDNFNAFKKLLNKQFNTSKYNNISLEEMIKQSNITQKTKYLITLKSI